MKIIYSLFADFIIVIHLILVCFYVFGELFVIFGYFFKWRWIRNFVFRIIHLSFVFIIAVESIIGIWCPLTVWEYKLRRLSGQIHGKKESFVGRLIGYIIYYDLPAWIFTVIYILFALLVLITFIIIPPVRKNKLSL